MGFKCEKCNYMSTTSNVKLSEEYIIYEGIKLFRIIATTDFGNVKRGDFGGFVQSLCNISNEAWIADDAKVYGDALIKGRAIASGNCIIKDRAVVSKHSRIKDNAIVQDNTKIFGWAKIYGNAVISKYGQVSQHASISGNAEVRGFVYGHTYLTCRAFVAEYVTVSGMAA